MLFSRFWPIRTIVGQGTAEDTRFCPSLGIFMCRALTTIVFGAAMLGAPLATQAQNFVSNLPVSPAIGSSVPRSFECPGPSDACALATASATSKSAAQVQLVPMTFRSADRTAPLSVQQTGAIPSDKIGASWRSPIAWLSTLALLGTIALRRYKARKR